MPISIKNDVKPMFGFGNNFSLRQTPYFIMGSYLGFIKGAVAKRRYEDFHSSWNFYQGTLDLTRLNRDLTKTLASKFNLKRPQDSDIFDDLWPIVKRARDYKKSVDGTIAIQLEEAYGFAATLAADDALAGNPPTWSRMTEVSHPNIVIFSDHHMTTFTDITLENYFKDYNRQLYLDVLDHYADRQYCLVENGDVEECVIYEPTENDAADRRAALKSYPILDNDRWSTFLSLRYAKRVGVLNDVISEFSDYYTLIRDRFINAGRYVRLTGNHDTYLDADRERDLRNRIQSELGVDVHDVLKIKRSGNVAYLVLHGHQFDTVSIQHSNIPFAKSLGEVFSETSAWIYQGPDRFWHTSDTKKWYNGNTFKNFLAREESGEYSRVQSRISVWDALASKAEADLIENNAKTLANIQADGKHWIESLLGHEIAWEYFENTNGFEALALEAWDGDETFKFRHLNERALCQRYSANYLNRVGPPFNVPIPKLVLGHTHEPRQNAVDPTNGNEAYYYLNTGSAGRFENLLWCVEINGSDDRVVSWSRVDGRLKKITWRSEHTEESFDVMGQQHTIHTSNLVHDVIEWF
jgi:UDP-2,3-diacylglucosamine pyrophosphatase LpxH